MITIALSQNGYFAVPLGYPLRLSPQTQQICAGVLPAAFTTVTATIKGDPGATFDAVLSLLAMPTTTTANTDGAVVFESTVTGGGPVASTLTVTATGAPSCYVVRLAITRITGTTPEAILRDGTTALASLPGIPLGVSLTSLVAS